MKISPIGVRSTFWYTLVVGGFLLLQGASTLLFRLVPALDAAFPALLGITHMIPIHSLLHITTGALALATIRWGGARGTWAHAVVWSVCFPRARSARLLIGDL